jgi:uncharacterized protein (TIGR00661 family)
LKKNNILTILIAPLDWGLGHATRCIPIIKALENGGFHVLIAANEKQKSLLQKEFSNIKFIEIEGYNIQYSKQNHFFVLKILFQIPRIVLSIKRENKWLKKVVAKEKVDLIISDNRFGLYHQTIPSIFITHQLIIKAPFKWLEYFIQKINYHFINRFTECWIPDNFQGGGLAGLLSHPKKMPTISTQYIGVLSRFEQVENAKIKYDVCVLLSGPEPQRTVLENILLQQMRHINLKILFVRGLPNTQENITSTSIEIKNHLHQNELQQAICSSNILIARSGYTTIMELLSLQKKSILIPTPGQTEQEYLATHLQNQNKCLAFKQNEFDFNKAYKKAQTFPFSFSTVELFSEDNVISRVNKLL